MLQPYQTALTLWRTDGPDETYDAGVSADRAKFGVSLSGDYNGDGNNDVLQLNSDDI